MTLNTIQTLRDLGFAVGNAHGSVDVENDALAAAQEAASPGAVIAQAGAITTMTLDDLANAGKLPVTTDQRQALASQIADAALEMVQSYVDETVAFHERAVAEATAMPDVWRVEQVVDLLGGASQTVLSLMVATKADGTGWDDNQQAVLDALADPVAFTERATQAQTAEAPPLA